MKRIHIGVIFFLILLSTIAVPTQGVSKTIDDKDNSGAISSNGDIYFFTFAFVKGEYENRSKWFTSYEIWNPDFSNTIDVLGYTAWDHQFYSVNAHRVFGSFRIGFIGRHHCCMFAWGYSGVTVVT